MMLFGDGMNYLELNKIFNKMIQKTQEASLTLSVSFINESLIIDKTCKK